MCRSLRHLIVGAVRLRPFYETCRSRDVSWFCDIAVFVVHARHSLYLVRARGKRSQSTKRIDEIYMIFIIRMNNEYV
jgi:hypothetical protein